MTDTLEATVLKSIFSTSKNDVREMIPSEARLYLTLSMGEQSKSEYVTEGDNFLIHKAVPGANLLDNLPPAVRTEFALQVICKRLAFHGPSDLYSPFMLIFAASMCTSPGEAVMWAHSIHKTQRQIGEVLTLMRWADFCPWGVPSRDLLRQRWHEQKGAPGSKVDNWLDRKEAWV